MVSGVQDDLGLLIKGGGEPNAWPRSKRKGAVNPKYWADLADDEGKGTAKSSPHTLAKHVDVTTRDLRARLRANPKLKTASRCIDEESAQKKGARGVTRSRTGWTGPQTHSTSEAMCGERPGPGSSVHEGAGGRGQETRPPPTQRPPLPRSLPPTPQPPDRVRHPRQWA
ncbi:RNase A-like domain-containing protein [Streptomyces sp. NPDC046197]|uniref:RNase A-like domain-containing protein n=1 Tax=Streptomyces sp. NPDC046197 TaxID=3154337 RepID=UPI0033CF58BD